MKSTANALHQSICADNHNLTCTADDLLTSDGHMGLDGQELGLDEYMRISITWTHVQTLEPAGAWSKWQAVTSDANMKVGL